MNETENKWAIVYREPKLTQALPHPLLSVAGTPAIITLSPTRHQLCCRRLGRLYFSGVKKRNTVGWQMAVCGLVQFEDSQPEA